MGAMMSVVKTLFVPAVISLILYVLTSHVLYPLWRSYRQRYAQYLPLNTLDGAAAGLSERTAGLRHRLSGAVGRFFSGASAASGGGGSCGAPRPSWRARLFGLGGWVRGRAGGADHSQDGDDDGDDGWTEEEGEELENVLYAGVPPAARSPGGGVIDSQRRLSRELEEGFMDDSDEDDEVTRRPGGR